MKKYHILLSIATFFLYLHPTAIQCSDATSHVTWTVVGAGPTGILAVGILLDSGIQSDQIVWLDPEFNVGRMGQLYQNVPGNGKVSQHIALLNTCKIFSEVKSESLEYLFNLPLDETPKLKVLIDPLLDITHYLKTKVITLEDKMMALDFYNDQWHIKTTQISFSSDNVVLATGAHPRLVDNDQVPQIPLDVALDKTTLAARLSPDDRVAVIGDGHSALLIVKYLTELPVSCIVNFYKNPIVYPTPMKGGIAWQEAGLKGELAQWAKTVLEVNPPQNLLRLASTPESIKQWLPTCTKVIYAIGFERNELPPINGDAYIYEKYDHSLGIIGPRLFGVGIAFPQEYIDPLNNIEYAVGLPYIKFKALHQALGRDIE